MSTPSPYMLIANRTDMRYRMTPITAATAMLTWREGVKIFLYLFIIYFISAFVFLCVKNCGEVVNLFLFLFLFLCVCIKLW